MKLKPGDLVTAACKVCQEVTGHEVIQPVSRGHVYIRCCACGTVQHFPKPMEARS